MTEILEGILRKIYPPHLVGWFPFVFLQYDNINKLHLPITHTPVRYNLLYMCHSMSPFIFHWEMQNFISLFLDFIYVWYYYLSFQIQWKIKFMALLCQSPSLITNNNSYILILDINNYFPWQIKFNYFPSLNFVQCYWFYFFLFI